MPPDGGADPPRSCAPRAEARLARDNTATVCSPCRRTHIENVRASLGSRQPEIAAAVKAAFDSPGSTESPDISAARPEDALDVLSTSQLLPFVSGAAPAVAATARRADDMSHVAAARR